MPGVYIPAYVFSLEAEVACDLGFEYAVLPQVSVGAICCFCNLHEQKTKKNRRQKEKKIHRSLDKLMYVCHECVLSPLPLHTSLN